MSEHVAEKLNVDDYVSKINWLVSEGREDLIDEIADEYERRRVVALSDGLRAA